MRVAHESTFRAPDGRALFYRYWPAQTATPRGAILLFHRGHEHSGRMAHIVSEIDLPGFAFFAWDARGHGRSQVSGERFGAATCVRDIEAFVEHIVGTHGFAREELAVAGQSMAGVFLAAWAHDYAPAIRAMVLASPAFRVKLYVPFARPALRLISTLRGDFPVKSYVSAKLLTHDPARVASFDSDPLVTRQVFVQLLLALDDLAQRVLADAEAVVVPTLLLISGSDWVVDSEPQHAFYERLGALTKARRVLSGFYHDTLGEKNRAQAIQEVRTFLLDRFASPLERPSLLAADKVGFTRREADSLARPLSSLSARGLYWTLMRSAIRIGGWLSTGIRIGRESGFDSGRSLDYVYRNVPAGRTPVGSWIDRVYLDAIGWQGVRQRKSDVEALIVDAIERLRRDDRRVSIVDIAAGAGRYVLDAIASSELPDAIELRDYSAANVAAGAALVRARGLDAIARFIRADAFDPATFASNERAFTLGIVSGLYELYADNERVSRSLRALARAIEDGGYLIYTGQPWHPQLELIARALTTHRDGAPWIMRRRTQAELDQLVAAEGFTKITQRIDERGMFSVSLARKLGPAQPHARAEPRIVAAREASELRLTEVL